MSSATAGWLQAGLLVAALAACYVPLGNYMARIFTTDKHWRVERGVLKIIGVDPKADQKWSAYLRSMLAFSLVSVLFLYGLEHGCLLRDQHELAELRRRGHHGLPGADGRSRGAELPVRRRRHRGRDRHDPRVHPVQDRQARQLLGGHDALRVP